MGKSKLPDRVVASCAWGCGRNALHGSEWCRFHLDPANRETLTQRRARLIEAGMDASEAARIAGLE
ncbi:MAG: hypothetical protein OXI50_06395 [Gammaproteobacteria bacterium]|nr:hypothetical protein [Gammaproteobacteria bacterium]MYC99458.1 NAD-glutamate dehydrogenase [Gammaproteobacteria bacterium]